MIVQNMIRVGIVSSIDESGRRIRATFPDRNNQVSAWLQLAMPPLKIDAYTELQMPSVGDQVLCLFLGNGLETGYWIGVIT